MDLKSHADHLIHKVFGGNALIRQMTLANFEVFVGTKSLSGESVSHFVDIMLRRGVKGVSINHIIPVGLWAHFSNYLWKLAAKEIEDAMDKWVFLFHLVDDKDSFEGFYRQSLAKRLILSKSVPREIERMMIARLKVSFIHIILGWLHLKWEKCSHFEASLAYSIGHHKGFFFSLSFSADRVWTPVCSQGEEDAERPCHFQQCDGPFQISDGRNISSESLTDDSTLWERLLCSYIHGRCIVLQEDLHGLDLTVRVLTAGIWPMGIASYECKLPSAPAMAFQTYKRLANHAEVYAKDYIMVHGEIKFTFILILTECQWVNWETSQTSWIECSTWTLCNKINYGSVLLHTSNEIIPNEWTNLIHHWKQQFFIEPWFVQILLELSQWTLPDCDAPPWSSWTGFHTWEQNVHPRGWPCHSWPSIIPSSNPSDHISDGHPHAF